MRRRLLNGTALGIAFAMGLPLAQPANAACVFPAPSGGDDALSCTNDSLNPSIIDLLGGNDSVTLDNVNVGDLNQISTFYGNSGNDSFSILNGSVLSFLSGSETSLLGGDGLDSFTFDDVMISVGVNTNALFDGGADNDSFVFSNNTQLGSGGRVTVLGGLGDDNLAFNSGTSVGGNGQTTIDGGDGRDSFSFNDAIVADGVGSTVTVLGGSGVDTFAFTNNAVVGGAGEATMDGGIGNDVFNFNDGVQVGSVAGTGRGVILGGLGEDSFNFTDSDPLDGLFNAIGYSGEGTLDAGDGNDSITSTGVSALWVGFLDDAHGVVNLGNGDDTMTGNIRIGFRGEGEVYGGSGVDRFSGMELTMAAGQSLGGTRSEALLDMGTGNDTVEYQEVGVGVSGDGTIAMGDGDDSFTASTNLFFSFGPGGSTTFDAGSGNDSFIASGTVQIGGAGTTVRMFGGQGDDDFSITGNPAIAGIGGDSLDDVVIDGGDGLDRLTFVMTNIGQNATVRGGDGDDVIALSGFSQMSGATAGPSYLFADSGNDTVRFDNATIGQGGRAEADAGAGDDTIEVVSGARIGSGYSPGLGLIGQGTLRGGDGLDNFTFDSAFIGLNAYGTVLGDAGNDIFNIVNSTFAFAESAVGSLNGGAGIDQITIDNGLVARDGTAWIDGGIDDDIITLKSGVEVAQSQTATAFIGGGDGSDDIFVTDTTFAVAGQATLAGGAGDDEFDISASTFADAVSASATLLGETGSDSFDLTNVILAKDGTASVFGDVGGDVFNLVDSVMAANQGSVASLDGGLGIDQITIDDGIVAQSGTAWIDGGGDADVITLKSGVEVALSQTATAFIGSGDGSDDIIVANTTFAVAGQATLAGGAGDDEFDIASSTLADTITASATLLGDTGNDSFDFTNVILGKAGAALVSGGDGTESFNILSGTVLGQLASGSGTIGGDSGNDTFQVGAAIIGGAGTGLLDGGAGDDLMTFSGSDIGASTGNGEVRGGLGNDTVTLLAASEVGANGTIDLGDNDDRLRVEDSTVLAVGAVLDGGANNDTLELLGTGTGQLPAGVLPVNFENLEKTQSGLWIWDQNATFSGTGDLQGGFFRVTSGTTLAFGGGLSVDAGAQLEGAGTIQGNVANAGAIRVGDAVGDISTFTIDGNYTGGGSLFVDVNVAGDGSPADVLVINGTISGVTTVFVNDLLGGTGGVPTAAVGSLIIDGNDPGPAAGAFTLGAQVISNMYEYFLVLDAGDWYLRNEVVNTGGGADLAMAGSLSLDAWHAGIRTLHLRMGELRGALLDNPSEELQSAELGASDLRQMASGRPGQSTVGVWSRVNGEKIEYEGTTLAGFRNTAWVAQVGYDEVSYDVAGKGDSLLIGGMLGMVSGENDVTDSATLQDYSGWSIGAYGSYISNGFHLDAMIKVDTLEIRHNMPLVGYEGDQNAWIYGASLEGGWRETFTSGLFLEADARMSFAHAAMEDLPDIMGSSATYSDGNSLRGRLGGTVGMTIDVDGAELRPFASLALEHEFLGETNLTVDAANFDSDINGTSVEMGGGLTVLDGGGNFGLYMSGHYVTGDIKEGVQVSAGLRLFW